MAQDNRQTISDNAHSDHTLIDIGATFNAATNESNTLICPARNADVNATDNGNTDAARALIDAGSDVNAIDTFGDTPLIGAAKSRDIEAVRTELIGAAESGNVDAVRALIDAGADVNANPFGGTALMGAVKSGNVEAVCALIAAVAADITIRFGDTALMGAARSGNVEAVRALIDAGADGNSNLFGGTALMGAVKSGNVEAVRALIAAGADVNANPFGKTVLMGAAESGNVEAVRALIDAGADVNANAFGGTALMGAARSGNVEAVRTLIAAGADVNVNTLRGTALMSAAESGNVEAVRALIDVGADFNANANVFGDTTLMVAVKSGNVEAVRTLIAAGADVNVNTFRGTALVGAAKSGNVEAVRTLIDAGADVNANMFSETALVVAAKSGNAEAIRALIDAGADVNARDDKGDTALMVAAKSGNARVVYALIIGHIDVNARNRFGQTALFCSVRSGSTNICRMLIEKGKALVNVKDKEGRTPLFFALHSHTFFNLNSFDVAQLLLDNGARIMNSGNLLMFWIEVYLKKELNLEFMLDYAIEKGFLKSKVLSAILSVFLCLSMSKFMDSKFTNQNAKLSLLRASKNYICNLQSVEKIEKLFTVTSTIENGTKENLHDVLHLLIQLEVDLDTVISEGNTVLHYCTRLPFFGVPKEVVMKIFKLLSENGATFNARNACDETPILFCLSSDTWRHATRNDTWREVKTLVELCQFLLAQIDWKCNETNEEGKTVFHLIMELFQVAFHLDDEEVRCVVLENALELLELFSPGESVSVNKLDNNLQSPLHLWATLCLSSAREYTGKVTKDHTFKEILEKILKHLLSCGAIVNAINSKEQTALHLCRTWSAVKLLIQYQANRNALDIQKRPPLLIAANANVSKGNPGKLYPDVTESSFAFFKECRCLGIDLWGKDVYFSKTILSILLESEDFLLTDALVQVACEDPNSNLEDILETVCSDASTHTKWNVKLVERIMKSNRHFNLSTPLIGCCKNIIELHDTESSVASGRDIHRSDDCNADDDDDRNHYGGDDDNDGTPPMKKSKYDASHERSMMPVHWEIAKLLLCYGADSGPCEDIARSNLELQSLLKSKVDISQTESILPWTSHSKVHKPKLDLVARRQNFKVVSNYWYHEEPIGKGAFGCVFAGINEKDGREAAIKRVEKVNVAKLKNKREIANLIELIDCKHVVQYISVDDQKEDFDYIFLELMEGNLEDFFNSADFDRSTRIPLCKHVLLGLDHLHKHKIVHRDLKPLNILYKTYPELILKIADFGLSRQIDANASFTLRATNFGTREWIAPEVVKSADHEHRDSSDVFSCGLVLHYIMSVQKHPFSPKESTGKSLYQVSTETAANMLKHEMTGWDSSLSLESTHLIKKLLEEDPKDRLTAAQALEHPMFWSDKEKINFLLEVGEEFRSNDNRTIRRIKEKLEDKFGVIVNHGAWTAKEYQKMTIILQKMSHHCKYDVKSVESLLRLLKNAKSHFCDQKCNPVGKLLLEDYIYLEYFPNLVMEIYKICVEIHHWDVKKLRIKHALRD